MIPEQPWLDGFNVSEDFIDSLSPCRWVKASQPSRLPVRLNMADSDHRLPMKHDVYVEHFERTVEADMDYLDMPMFSRTVCESLPGYGTAPGGLMRQEIYEDEYGIDAWDQDNGFRCFIHLANSAQYLAIMGHQPPHTPPTAKDYTSAGLPWFDYYSDSKALVWF